MYAVIYVLAKKNIDKNLNNDAKIIFSNQKKNVIIIIMIRRIFDYDLEYNDLSLILTSNKKCVKITTTKLHLKLAYNYIKSSEIVWLYIEEEGKKKTKH